MVLISSQDGLELKAICLCQPQPLEFCGYKGGVTMPGTKQGFKIVYLS